MTATANMHLKKTWYAWDAWYYDPEEVSLDFCFRERHGQARVHLLHGEADAEPCVADWGWASASKEICNLMKSERGSADAAA